MRWFRPNALLPLLVLVITSCSVLSKKPSCPGNSIGSRPGGEAKENVNECASNPGICGDELAICTDAPRGFNCECPEEYLPSPGTVSLLLNELDDDLSHPAKNRRDVFFTRGRLVAKLVQRTSTHMETSFSTKTTEGDVLSIGPNASLSAFPQLKLPSADVYLDIDLEGVALNNNGSASVALVSYSDMLDLLSADLFRPNVTTVKKSLLSRVVSATLEDVTDANLSSSVNFTLRHIVSRSQGNLSCVYWEEGEGEWSDEGCSVTESNSTHTICSCTHLSTFSLILHAEEFAPDLVLLLLNVVAASLGLLCLLAAVVTFALCRKNPAVSDPARLHMALCLLLAQLLFLNIQSISAEQEVTCGVLSVLTHFLYLSCFVWMTVETVVLLHATRGLQQLSRNAPLQPPAPWKYVYAMAYGVPLVVVAVSVGMRPDAYGSEQCWLSRSDGFIWSFTGSLLVMFGVNAVLFMVIFIILRLSEYPDPNVSYASGLTLKAVFQFVILSLPWILGIVAPSYEGLEILVILLHSQQGSCLFIMHCVFNAEVLPSGV
ncbi:putative adhesion G protein-coupled receptor E4P [Engraulis encrasicolus]|uniref:putative adhesion G protein-coupled receptor E4P n=1 Tax=Engraulis encrasicolus TaxID=184585 RepID=UPI002FD7520E